MADLLRYRVAWSGGGTTGPGVSTLFFSTTATGAAASVKTMFTAVAGNFPTAVVWTFPTGGDVIDVDTGTLTGSWDDGGSASSVTGSAAGAVWAQGVGVRINWATTGLVRGRRVAGKTFFTSIATGAFQNDGSPLETVRTAFAAAGNALRVAQPLQVWSRPVKDPDTGAIIHVGQTHTVTAASCPDTVTWLRSRRT
jgi:hypothetical protein